MTDAEGPSLIIRQVRPEDSLPLLRLRNAERARPMFVNDGLVSQEAHEAWFAKSFPTMRDIWLVVEWDARLVARFQIEDWKPDVRKGEYGVAADTENGPLGLGTVLPVLALGHAFLRLGAVEMIGRVLDINTDMNRIMTRLGLSTDPAGTRLVQRPSGETLELFEYRIPVDAWEDVRRRGLAMLPRALRMDVERALEAPVAE